MNRKSYIALVVASLSFLAACTERPVDPVPSGPEASHSYIFFEPEVIESVESRAALVSGTSFPKEEGSAFGVMGYTGSPLASVFADPGIAEVSWDGQAYTYEGLAIWHGLAVHNFYAYYPYSLSSGTVVQNSGNPYITYTQPENEATMQDILTAYTSLTSKDGPAVPLGFHHRLWALDVIIENSQSYPADKPYSSTMTVNSISLKLNDYPTGAQVYLDKKTSTILNNEPKDFTYRIPVNESNATIPDASVKDDSGNSLNFGKYGPLLFLPVESGSFKYDLTISYKDATGKDASFSTGLKTSKVKFEEGKRYTLTIKKTNDQFVVGSYFDAGNWTDASVNHTFN